MKKLKNLLLTLLSVACVSAFAGCQFGAPTQNGGSSSSTSEKVSSSSVKENSSSEEEASSSKGSSSSGKESSSSVGGSSSSEDSSSSVEESSSSEDSSSSVGGDSSSDDSSSSVGGNPPITGAGCTEEEWNATMEALADVDNVTMTGGSISIDHNGEEGATKQVSTVLKLTEKGTYIYGVHMDGSSAGYVYEEYYIKEGSSYTEYFRSRHANEEWSEWRCYPDKKMGFSMADLTTIIPDDYSLYEYDAESGYMVATDVQHYSAALNSTLEFKTVAIQIVDGQLTSVAAEFAETVDLGFDICSLAFSYTDYGETTFELPFYSDSECLEFTLNEDEISYSVTDIGTCKDTDIVIPATYEGLPVTAIGYSAFRYCESLTSIEIPDSVTEIGNYAFYECSSLTSVVIPDSVTTIGNYAFYECSSLTIYSEVASQPSGWDSDWKYSSCPVVWDCNHNDVADDGYIYTVVDGIRYGIKDGVATVVSQPNNMTTVNISESITYKGVEYRVTAIGYSAFYNCSSLTSIEIPDSVTAIGYSAFKGCENLTSIEIPDSVTAIGYSAFYNCSSLTSIEIPNSVTTIGNGAFYDCDSLTSVVIGNGVTTIGNYAFEDCGTLTSVVIGDNVTSIGDWAFYYCKKLTSITFEGTIAEWNAIEKGDEWNDDVPATEVVCKDGSVAL